MISAAACQLTAGRCGNDRLARWLWAALALLCRLAACTKTHPGSSRFTGWLARKTTQDLNRCRAALTELAELAPDAVEQALAIVEQLPGPAGPDGTVRDEHGRLVDLYEVGRGLGDVDEFDRRVGLGAEDRARRLQIADQLAARGPRLSGCVARWWWATLIILARRLVGRLKTGLRRLAAELRRLATPDLPRLRLLTAGRWLDEVHCPGRPEAVIRACPPRAPCLAGGRTGKAAPMTG